MKEDIEVVAGRDVDFFKERGANKKMNTSKEVQRWKSTRRKVKRQETVQH